MLARFIYSHPRYFFLLVICVVAVGLNSYQSIPRQEKPSITNMSGTVTVFFPGASPRRVEALVTRPLEDELRQIPEIDQVQS
ncbi:MAG: efflux RND transporter permease subunit, partial [Halioglobus sp.]|nr:efflux RND transporter permease subunit [Halioglobus sp.]